MKSGDTLHKKKLFTKLFERKPTLQYLHVQFMSDPTRETTYLPVFCPCQHLEAKRQHILIRGGDRTKASPG